MIKAKLSTLRILLYKCGLHRNWDSVVYTNETIEYKQYFLFVGVQKVQETVFTSCYYSFLMSFSLRPTVKNILLSFRLYRYSSCLISSQEAAL